MRMNAIVLSIQAKGAKYRYLKLTCHIGLIKFQHVELIYIVTAYGDDKQTLNIEGIRNHVSLFRRLNR